MRLVFVLIMIFLLTLILPKEVRIMMTMKIKT